jgi:hypothetical protein
MADLDADIAAFKAQSPELEKAYPRKFVVFHGGQFVGAWDTFDAAAADAVARFGRGPYLIRQVGVPAPTIPASVMYRELMA